MVKILLYITSVAVMISLIPFVENDYVLALIYLGFILAIISIKKQKKDILFLAFGLVGMTVSEIFFIKMGVETFNRQTLFGLMPLWLPFLWSYAFLIMRRCIHQLEQI